jgi:uncharacterized protein
VIFSWAFIGIAVGLLLGITAAGGAIVAVPLFVFLANVSIRDATVLSLIAVMAGALLNWLVQTRNTDFRLGLLLFVFSTVGSILSKPMKARSPEWVLTALFVSVALVSLISIWKESNADNGAPSSATAGLKPFLLKTALGGLGLGGLIARRPGLLREKKMERGPFTLDALNMNTAAPALHNTEARRKP